jgi:hypothetical protein
MGRGDDPLTQADLGTLPCVHPDCGATHHAVPISGNCHPSAPVFMLYNQASGTLILRCAVCRGRLTEILIAPAPPDPLKPRPLTPAELDALGYDA